MPIISSMGAASSRGFGQFRSPPAGPLSPALLLHADNSGDPNVFINNGSAPVTFSRRGNVAQSTVQTKFGPSSLVNVGSTLDTLDIIGDSINIDSGDFTLDCWVFPTLRPGTKIVAGRWNGGQSYTLSIDAGRLDFAWAPFSTQQFMLISTGALIALNTWSHIAVTREGNVWSLWQNGTRVATTTFAGNATAQAGVPTMIGSYIISGTTPTGYYTGYIDELRLIKQAMYSGTTYTVPTAPYPPP